MAVFASGKGSNLRAIDEAIRTHLLTSIEIALVISNNSKCEALEYARSHAIETAHSSVLSAGSEEAHANELLRLLREHSINLIALAGYMKRIPKAVVTAYNGRILNIHPALLPDFGGEGMYGMNVHRAVVNAARTITGATVHYVGEEYDSGAIIAQAKCVVEVFDTAETVAQKVLELEHGLYPRAIQIVVERLRGNSA